MSATKKSWSRSTQLTQDILIEFLDYCPETGVFTRKVRTSNRVKVGDIAGAKDSSGYVRFMAAGRLYLAHRLAWLYMNGCWPANHLDHINGDITDNRIANLREATSAQNSANCPASWSNKSGFKGVSRSRGKWRAQISVNNKKIALGAYSTPELAHAAYREAAEKYHGDFANFKTREEYPPQGRDRRRQVQIDAQDLKTAPHFNQGRKIA